MKEFDFEKVPIVEIANEILLDAVKKNVSDIHFDPTKDALKIRIRIDGELSDYSLIPSKYKRNLVSRIKMIAGMNIMETRLPQDGAIKTKIGDKVLDVRVSSLPTNCGEKVVLRILDYAKSFKGLDSLGFSPDSLEKIKKMISIPNGIILVTGATGSGKSTTVYSILQQMNTEEVNIITVEDPVEMDIPGINQVQANSEIGLTFANVLRSILRQDPDIIMIGEIRDDETARIAVRASITGHKVLSTIHTNNSLNTIERLTDMDVERYLLGSALNGIISQKLARKICPNCRVLRETNNYEKMVFKKVLGKDIPQMWDVNPEGCEHCFKGYTGRIALHEILVMDDEIRDAITNAMPKDHLRKLVYGGNVVTLLQDGLDKVIEGETSFSEILKAVDLDNDLGNYEEDNLKNSLNDVEVNKAAHELQTMKPTVKEQKKETINYTASIPTNPENKTVVPTINQPAKEPPVVGPTVNVNKPQSVVTPSQPTPTVKPIPPAQPVTPTQNVQSVQSAQPGVARAPMTQVPGVQSTAKPATTTAAPTAPMPMPTPVATTQPKTDIQFFNA